MKPMTNMTIAELVAENRTTALQVRVQGARVRREIEELQGLLDHQRDVSAALVERLGGDQDSWVISPGQANATTFLGDPHGHFRRVCTCGAVIAQCRCPGPKADEIIPNGCPACWAWPKIV